MKRPSVVHGQVRSLTEYCIGLLLQHTEKESHPNVYSGVMNSVIVCGEIPGRRIKVCSACLRRMDSHNVP